MDKHPRLKECVDAWPDCEAGAYDPRCCRFPKSCSCTVFARVVEVEDQAMLDLAARVKMSQSESFATIVDALRHTWRSTGSCPCGARREALDTHPHVAGCPVGKALEMIGEIPIGKNPLRSSQ